MAKKTSKKGGKPVQPLNIVNQALDQQLNLEQDDSQFPTLGKNENIQQNTDNLKNQSQNDDNNNNQNNYQQSPKFEKIQSDESDEFISTAYQGNKPIQKQKYFVEKKVPIPSKNTFEITTTQSKPNNNTNTGKNEEVSKKKKKKKNKKNDSNKEQDQEQESSSQIETNEKKNENSNEENQPKTSQNDSESKIQSQNTISQQDESEQKQQLQQQQEQEGQKKKKKKKNRKSGKKKEEKEIDEYLKQEMQNVQKQKKKILEETQEAIKEQKKRQQLEQQNRQKLKEEKQKLLEEKNKMKKMNQMNTHSFQFSEGSKIIQSHLQSNNTDDDSSSVNSQNNFKQSKIKFSEQDQINIIKDEIISKTKKKKKYLNENVSPNIYNKQLATLCIGMQQSKGQYSSQNSDRQEQLQQVIYTPNTLSRIRQYYIQGKSLYKNKKFQQAINYFKQAIDECKMLDQEVEITKERHWKLKIIKRIGKSYMKLNSYQIALLYMKLVYEIDPNNLNNCSYLAECLLANEQFSESLQIFSQLVKSSKKLSYYKPGLEICQSALTIKEAELINSPLFDSGFRQKNKELQEMTVRCENWYIAKSTRFSQLSSYYPPLVIQKGNVNQQYTFHNPSRKLWVLLKISFQKNQKQGQILGAYTSHSMAEVVLLQFSQIFQKNNKDFNLQHFSQKDSYIYLNTKDESSIEGIIFYLYQIPVIFPFSLNSSFIVKQTQNQTFVHSHTISLCQKHQKEQFSSQVYNNTFTVVNDLKFNYNNQINSNSNSNNNIKQKNNLNLSDSIQSNSSATTNNTKTNNSNQQIQQNINQNQNQIAQDKEYNRILNQEFTNINEIKILCKNFYIGDKQQSIIEKLKAQEMNNMEQQFQNIYEKNQRFVELNCYFDFPNKISFNFYDTIVEKKAVILDQLNFYERIPQKSKKQINNKDQIDDEYEQKQDKNRAKTINLVHNEVDNQQNILCENQEDTMIFNKFLWKNSFFKPSQFPLIKSGVQKIIVPIDMQIQNLVKFYQPEKYIL